MVSPKQGWADTGGQSLPTPQPTIHTHTHSQTHTAGQSFFTQPNGPLTGLGEGLPPCKADWQDWHLHIATLIMGICLDAPVWGPSRVPGCCHRDGGEPLVVWGADRDPVILLRGGQTWPPMTRPFWFGWETASSQSGERQIISGSFRGLCVQILWDWPNWQILILVQEYCVTVWVLLPVSESQMSMKEHSVKNFFRNV